MSTHTKQRKAQNHAERISVHRVTKDITMFFNSAHTAPTVRGNELKDATQEMKR